MRLGEIGENFSINVTQLVAEGDTVAVADVEQAVERLGAAGVRFEHYEGELSTGEHGIFRGEGRRSRGFADPAGNVLSVLETS